MSTLAERFPVLGCLLLVANAVGGCLGDDGAPEGKFEYAILIDSAFVTDQRNQSLLGAATLPEATAFLNQNLRLPLNIPVQYITCPQANAFWSAQNRSIQICHQLGAFLLPHVRSHLASAAAGEYKTEADFEADVLAITLNAVRFVYFHEVGHALVQLYNLPITGREEDVADQFATWIMLRDRGPNTGHVPYDMSAGQAAALSGAIAFLAFAHNSLIAGISQLNWAQTHSFDLARTFNIVCWTYGSEPTRLAWLTPVPTQADRLHVPAHRERWCNYEWQRIDFAFTTLLGDHLR